MPGKGLKAELEDVKVDSGNGKVLKIETDQKDNEGHEGEDSDNSHEEGVCSQV